MSTTITLQVSTATTNDGYSNSTFGTNGSNNMVGCYTETSNIFSRFLNVTIPKGSIIESAKLQYCSCDWDVLDTPCNTTIYFNNVNTATSPTTVSTYNSKALTTASVPWQIPPWTGGTWYDSPDIKTIIQEIVNRAGWVSGNAMLCLHKGSTSGTYRYVRDYSYSPTYAPKLVVTYTPPTTLTLQVSTSADDGYTGDGDNLYNNATLYVYKWLAYSSHLYARFPNVTIPKGSTIVSAKIQECADLTESSASCTTLIYLNNEDNAVVPTTNTQYNAKTLTSSVAWTIPAMTLGTWYDSPDLTTIVQAIVNRAGWASGNAMMIMHKLNTSTAYVGRQIKGYDQGASTAMKLVIGYHPPPVTTKGYYRVGSTLYKSTDIYYRQGGVLYKAVNVYERVNGVLYKS